jgi:hypothetical protein
VDTLLVVSLIGSSKINELLGSLIQLHSVLDNLLTDNFSSLPVDSKRSNHSLFEDFSCALFETIGLLFDRRRIKSRVRTLDLSRLKFSRIQ